MLKEIFDKQRVYTHHYFEALDLSPIEKLVELILNSEKSIIFTGVGKSGLVAKKIALTMVSTGTKALYLSPTDAVHGDVGIVSKDDIFILLSKSGESDELLNLVPAIRNKGAVLVAIVCNAQSRLAAACHLVITLPFQEELCPFDMAPTMSTAFQALFGDLVTVALMRKKNFSMQDYALNHPSGRIGKRMILKVKDLMLTGDKIPLCHPNDRLKDILVELSNKRCGCILIVDQDKRLLGIFTDGDLRRMLQKVGGGILEGFISEMMTPNPRAILPDLLAYDAMKLMEADYSKRISVFPVIDDEHRIVGLLHIHDIIQTGL
jgi:arabinose-5-phosphate isomerase